MGSHVINTLVLEHNGQPDELVWAWDIPSAQLTLGGFKRLGGTLTWIDITYTLLSAPTVEIKNTLLVGYWDDSNDIKNNIITFLEGSITGLQANTVYETPARVDIDVNLEITYFDFKADVPTLNLTSTGTGIWQCLTAEAPEGVKIPLAHMQGISAARGRTLAWDRENAIYRSGSIDPFDFAPSLTTQAAVGKASAVRGEIMLIAGYPDGYVVYSSDNIVRAAYTGDSYVFQYREVVDIGISDPRHVYAVSSRHLLYTSSGLVLFVPQDGQMPKSIDPLIDNYLANYVWPFDIRYLEDRYAIIGLPCLSATDVMLAKHRNITLLSLPPAPPPVGNLPVPLYPFNAGNYPSKQRIIVIDTKLGKIGSCDSGAMLLWGCTPVNAAGVLFGKGIGRADQAWGHYGRGLGIVTSGAMPAIASCYPVHGGELYLGYTRAQPRGYSTFTEIRTETLASGVTDLEMSIEAYDEYGVAVAQAAVPVEVNTGTLAAQTIFDMDVTGVYGVLHAKGLFDLTNLRYTCFEQGRF
jgi:hypothetical protein